MAKSASKAPGFLRQVSDALLLDLAFVVNQSLLIGEFLLNRAYVRDSTPISQPPPSPQYRGINSVRLLLAMAAIFAIYGPTMDAACSVVGPRWTGIVLQTLGIAALLAGGFAFYRFLSSINRQVDARIQSTQGSRNDLSELNVRRRTFKLMARVIALILPLAPALVALVAATDTRMADDFCHAAAPNRTAGLQFLLALGSVAAAFALAHPNRVGSSTGWRPFGFFLTVLVLHATIVLGLGKGLEATEAEYLPYLHVYPILLVLLFGVSVGAKPLVAELLDGFVAKKKSLFTRQLSRTELFISPRKLTVLPKARRYYGLLYAPFSHPLHLLLLPSLVALIAPQVWLMEFTTGAFLIGYLMLVWNGISRHWDTIVFVVERYFLQGLPLLISILVIVLGVLRIGDLHYVATLLAVAPLGAVTMIIVMSYIALWLFDFYVNRPLQMKLMELLGASAGQERIRYSLDSGYDCMHRLDIVSDNRDLQIHSGSWFAVVGEIERDPGVATAERDIGFRVWSMMDLFDRLADSGWCQPTGRDGKPSGNPPNIDSEVSYLQRRVRLYRLIMNGLAFIVLVVFFGGLGYLNGENKAPLVDAYYYPEGDSPGAPFDLVERLAQQTDSHRPAILLAASGGGTRAALYTYSVLLGLHEQKALDDLVLVSGVSGGGVSLAYFAAHFDQLKSAQGEYEKSVLPASWERYQKTMAAPFINDVLESIFELRTFWKTGWSQLLAESFSRRFYSSRQTGTPCPTVAGSHPFGLIFNTTITGHPFDDAQLTARLFEGKEDQARQRFYSNLSGARLIFTNLNEGGGFPLMNDPPKSLVGQDIHLPYRVVQDASVCLTQAGTLTANFPPVFPDALVSLTSGSDPKQKKHYKVTDGGATDNRGLFSLLYALQGALSRMNASQIPDIHILVADASAFDYDYSDTTRGLGTALSGSKERVGNGLIDRLYKETLEMVLKSGRTIKVHYLPMPTILRSGGGLGTHWMMPEDFKVIDPYDPAPVGLFSKAEPVDKKQFFMLLDRLYTKSFPSPDPLPEFYDWICRPGLKQECVSADRYAEQWQELARALDRSSTKPGRHSKSASGNLDISANR